MCEHRVVLLLHYEADKKEKASLTLFTSFSCCISLGNRTLKCSVLPSTILVGYTWEYALLLCVSINFLLKGTKTHAIRTV